MVALLDVNLLIALFDATHIHHEEAHLWFADNRECRWATCAITENAVVRILSNPTYPGRRTTMQDATSRLDRFCGSDQHEFWTDSVSLRNGDRFRLHHVQGHRQLTDVYLLGLAVENQGRLATLDASIPLRSVAGAGRANLEAIRS